MMSTIEGHGSSGQSEDTQQECKHSVKHPGLSEAEYDDLKCTFDMFDKDKSGAISLEELGDMMRVYGQNPTEKELEVMLEKSDFNKNGVLDLDEFTALLAEYKVDPEEELAGFREAFNVFDRDHDGFIDASELRKVVTEIGEEKISEKEFDEIMKEADSNNDGKIDCEEFITYMLSCQ
ncbi:neo-calmodulin-like [Glandiceps talaboti]